MNKNDLAVLSAQRAWLGAIRSTLAINLLWWPLALWALPLKPVWAMALLSIALIERYALLRLRFDEALLAAIERGSISDELDLDQALHRLGLIRTPVPREWSERQAGIRRWTLRFGLLCLLGWSLSLFIAYSRMA